MIVTPVVTNEEGAGRDLAAGPPVRCLLPQLVLEARTLRGREGQVSMHLRLRRGLLRRGLQRAGLSPRRCVVVGGSRRRPGAPDRTALSITIKVPD